METQVHTDEFQPGSFAVYAFHGKCQIVGIETKQIGNEAIRFYKVEVQKSTLSRSARPEPAIWVPVASAKERGLRAPVSNQEATLVMNILNSREYYFPLNETWQTVRPRIEATIRNEGCQGIAKAISYLYTLKRKQVVLPVDVNRFYEGIQKLFMREMTEALGVPARDLEEQMNKALRKKLIADH